MTEYYTYHITDPETNKIFYVGKGHGQRAYIHMTRALAWRETGKLTPGANKHLYNKLLNIYDKKLEPIYSIVFTTEIEKEALHREEEDIRSFGIENLCNLTYGGEGETRSGKALENLSKSLQEFWNSEDGYTMRKQFSEMRTGDKNPMWGIKEDEEHKKERMKNCLAMPRWNKGLKGDPRSKGPPKGSIPHNAIKCKLSNEDGRSFEAISLTELAKLSGVPLVSIGRLRKGVKNRKGWRLEII
jgi:hypothetical protein